MHPQSPGREGSPDTPLPGLLQPKKKTVWAVERARGCSWRRNCAPRAQGRARGAASSLLRACTCSLQAPKWEGGTGGAADALLIPPRLLQRDVEQGLGEFLLWQGRSRRKSQAEQQQGPGASEPSLDGGREVRLDKKRFNLPRELSSCRSHFCWLLLLHQLFGLPLRQSLPGLEPDPRAPRPPRFLHIPLLRGQPRASQPLPEAPNSGPGLNPLPPALNLIPFSAIALFFSA